MLKRFFECLKVELKYTCKTKLIWGIVISLLVCSGLLAITQCNYATKWAYRDYKYRVHCLEETLYYREQRIKEGTCDFEGINRQLQEYRDEIEEARKEVANAVYVESPEYRATYALEESSAYIGLMSIVIGASIMVSDHKNKTLRHKVLRFGKINYTASKVVTLLILSIFTVATLVLLGNIEGACVYSVLQKSIPLNEIKLPSITLASGIFVKASIITLYVFIYSLIGGIIATIFKSATPAVVLKVIQDLFFNFNAKYLPVNIFMNLIGKHFDFVGNVKLGHVIKTSMPVVSVYLVTLVVSLIGTLTLINYKRSAYK